MGMTMIENLLARKAGVKQVRPGDIVTVEVDMCVMIDLQFATLEVPVEREQIRDREGDDAEADAARGDCQQA